MPMTAAELIEILQDLDPETEVRLAQQPSYPMEASLSIRTANDDESERPDDADPPIVWLAEGRQLGYLPGFVAEQLGWS